MQTTKALHSTGKEAYSTHVRRGAEFTMKEVAGPQPLSTQLLFPSSAARFSGNANKRSEEAMFRSKLESVEKEDNVVSIKHGDSGQESGQGDDHFEIALAGFQKVGNFTA